MAKNKKDLPPFEESKCECCGQTTDYAVALDRGTALIVLAIYNAVRKKNKNKVHLRKEMECRDKDYSSYRDMVSDGHMTSRMIDNVLRAKYHGLVAQVDGGGQGEYLITPKGARFLRNEQLPRIAVIDKATHTKKQYWNEIEDRTTFTELMRKETPFWNIEPFEVEADGSFRGMHESPTASMF